jgi:two-component system, NarL family, nitrate/nitrite response regulator NarL
MTLRFLIADDHALMRDALELTIRRNWPSAKIVLVKDFTAAWAVATEAFDLCICDLSMPGASATDGIQRLLSIQPEMRLIAITGSSDANTLRKILAMNVAGIISKTADGEVVEDAIRLVLAGEKYRLETLPEVALPSPLTATQTQVILLIRQGQSNKEIAKALSVAPSTVKTHIDNILKRLGARNRADACQRFSNIP